MLPQDFSDVTVEQAYRYGALRPSKAATIHFHFSTVPLFSNCSKRELRLVAKTAIIEPRAKGAELVTEGDVGDKAFVLLQGTCKVVRKGRKVATLEPGAVVGELSMLNRGARNATVVAETPLEVAVLGRKAFLKVVESTPSICFKLLESLAARIQELDARSVG